ncbi:hypothetical protein KSS87_011031, partial [Heliosperma pusillum]
MRKCEFILYPIDYKHGLVKYPVKDVRKDLCFWWS